MEVLVVCPVLCAHGQTCGRKTQPTEVHLPFQRHLHYMVTRLTLGFGTLLFPFP